MFELTNERKKEAKEGIDWYNELVMNKNIKRSRKKEEKKRGRVERRVCGDSICDG